MNQLQSAVALHRQGRLKEALALYNQILNTQPGQPDALHLSGLCLFQLGQVKPGLARLEAAVAARPEAIDYLRNLAQAYKQASQPEKAEDALQKLLDLAPEDRQALYGLAELAMQASAFDQALELCAKLRQIEGDSPALINAEATTLIRAGWAQDGLNHLSRLANSLSADDLYQKAVAEADLGQVVNCEATLETLLGQNPKHAPALWQRGLCRFDRGDLPAAREDFAAARQINPNLPLARAYLAIADSELGKDAAAQSQFQELQQSHPHMAPLIDAQTYRKAAEKAQGAAISFRAFTASTLRDALRQAPGEGLILEFGVYTGRSINVLAEAGRPVTGFDSFEGLPERWNSAEDRGAYNTKGRLPEVPDHVRLVQGWFKDSLPPFLSETPGHVALVNIDCDLYSSTLEVLNALAPRIQSGSLLVFDEYFGYPDWENHEFKAFQEASVAFGWRSRYLALSPMTRQAVLRIE